ncbi:hypothetical protein L9F63_027999, partial [Diploptera punctata]
YEIIPDDVVPILVRVVRSPEPHREGFGGGYGGGYGGGFEVTEVMEDLEVKEDMAMVVMVVLVAMEEVSILSEAEYLVVAVKAKLQVPVLALEDPGDLNPLVKLVPVLVPSEDQGTRCCRSSASRPNQKFHH